MDSDVPNEPVQEVGSIHHHSIKELAGMLVISLVILGLAGVSSKVVLGGKPTTSSLKTIVLNNGETATPNMTLADLDNDGSQEIFVIAYTSGIGDELQVFKADGTPINNQWPFRIKDRGVVGFTSVSVGDVTGDGLKDVVILGTQYQTGEKVLYIVSSLGQLEGAGTIPVSVPSGDDAYQVSLVDYDSDGVLDMVVPVTTRYTKEGSVKVFKSDGRLLNSFPIHNLAAPAVAVADIDGNCSVDIASEYGDTSGGGLYLIRNSIATSTPSQMNPLVPSVADMNNQGGGSIVLVGQVGTSTQIVMYSSSGTELWRRTIPALEVIYGTRSKDVTIANIDSDPDKEIIVDLKDGSVHKLYAYKANGTPVSGWPITTGFTNVIEGGWSGVFTPRLAVDLGGGAANEIVVPGVNKQGQVLIGAWNGNGTPVAGFPIQTTDTKEAYGYPDVAFGDIDKDGYLDMVVVDSYNSPTRHSQDRLRVRTQKLGLAGVMDWPQVRHDERKTGRLGLSTSCSQ